MVKEFLYEQKTTSRIGFRLFQSMWQLGATPFRRPWKSWLYFRFFRISAHILYSSTLPIQDYAYLCNPGLFLHWAYRYLRLDPTTAMDHSVQFMSPHSVQFRFLEGFLPKFCIYFINAPEFHAEFFVDFFIIVF